VKHGKQKPSVYRHHQAESGLVSQMREERVDRIEQYNESQNNSNLKIRRLEENEYIKVSKVSSR
jgi:hypothetical protein